MGTGAELKRIRTANGLSVKKFTELIDIDADRYTKWEQKDISNIKEEDEKKLVAFFKVPVAELHTVTKLQNKSKIVPVATAAEKPPVKVQEVDAQMMGKLIRLEARQVIHEALLAEIYAKVSGKEATKILKQLQMDVDDEAGRIFRELDK